MPDGIYVDMKGLRDLAKDLERSADGLSIAIQTTMASEAKAIAREAATIAASYTSTSANPDRTGTREAIANSVHAVRRSRREYRIEAGGEGLSLAGLWELGNKGSDPNAPSFRHPAFGRKDFYEQQKWPFLRMAVERHLPITLSVFSRLVNSVLRKNRL